MTRPSTPPHYTNHTTQTPHYDYIKPTYEEPLYTEINIPLPQIPSSHPQPPSTPTPSPSPSPSHTRTRSLTSFSPFTRTRSTSSPPPPPPPRKTDEWPRVRPSILRSREVAAAMDLGHAGKRGRSGTVDALAVVPAVLVLSAELFTPGSGEGGRGRGRGRKGVGRWEEGIR
ncbi:hypothetical protein GQ44DRAFT_774001 [Phaeosphaeriaceae sp. PMI808]|nr:hypothetical protein GQ44DRAFT_774001 [Phaeosphaeriaceae sp. PMI808]